MASVTMDMKLELVAVPVTDADRAKQFYVEKIGFVEDNDQTVSDQIRFVQLTPPGSACSIAIGKGPTGRTPGSLDNMQMMVADAQAAHAAAGSEPAGGGATEPRWPAFLRQFQDLLIVILLVAAAVSAVVTREWETSIAIVVVVPLNVTRPGI